jgi:hypothetical protein
LPRKRQVRNDTFWRCIPHRRCQWERPQAQIRRLDARLARDLLVSLVEHDLFGKPVSTFRIMLYGGSSGGPIGPESR